MTDKTQFKVDTGMMDPGRDDMQAAMELQGKIFGDITGALTANLAALGDRLGIYKALKDGVSVNGQNGQNGQSGLTPAQLADKMDLNERFLREWLYQQACAGLVTADDTAEHFHLTPAQQMVLANEAGPDASPFFSAGLYQSTAAFTSVTTLENAFRTGQGWSFDELDKMTGGNSTCGVCRFLGVWVRYNLVDSLTSLPGMKAKLEAGITIADVGCGAAETMMSLAKAFPKCTFHGYDISQRSLDMAKERQESMGLMGVDMKFLNPDKGEGLPDASVYDLIVTMDAVHDMARPDLVMPLVRKALKTSGGWLVFDLKGAPTPAQNIKAPEGHGATFYGFSIHACLPSGLSEEGGLGLGALGWQEDVARSMALEAGFTRFEVLDFKHPMNNIFWIQP